MNELHEAIALNLLSTIKDEHVDLIYTDPPFGTGNKQELQRRKGNEKFEKMGYVDRYDDYMNFMTPHLIEFHRVLKDTGTAYIHLDYRWVHYVKVECDKIFGYDNFLNEIIWSYNFGGRGKDKWPAKHDTILVYVKNKGKHTFNWEDIDRVPYVAPALQYVGRTKEEAEKRIAMGQVPTDVWTMSIVGTASKERVGYPNQKPVKLIERAVMASSNAGDLVLDPFCGSGTTGIAAHNLGRHFLLSDSNKQAVRVTQNRLNKVGSNFLLKLIDL